MLSAWLHFPHCWLGGAQGWGAAAGCEEPPATTTSSHHHYQPLPATSSTSTTTHWTILGPPVLPLTD